MRVVNREESGVLGRERSMKDGVQEEYGKKETSVAKKETGDKGLRKEGAKR